MPNKTTEEQIKKILEKDIAPMLARDGGSVQFINYENGILQVKLQGACHGCPGAVMTLKYVIEDTLKSEIAEIKEVIAV